MVWFNDCNETFVNIDNWDFLLKTEVRDLKKDHFVANGYVLVKNNGEKHCLGFDFDDIYLKQDNNFELITKGVKVNLKTFRNVVYHYLKKIEPSKFSRERLEEGEEYFQEAIASNRFIHCIHDSALSKNIGDLFYGCTQLRDYFDIEID